MDSMIRKPASVVGSVWRLLAGHPDGELALDRHEQALATSQAPLEAELTAAGAASDADWWRRRRR